MKFPTVREEITATQQQFYEECKFPGVLGVFDGTHIYIRSTGGDNIVCFITRKNRYLNNVQVLLTIIYP